MFDVAVTSSDVERSLDYKVFCVAFFQKSDLECFNKVSHSLQGFCYVFYRIRVRDSCVSLSAVSEGVAGDYRDAFFVEEFLAEIVA